MKKEKKYPYIKQHDISDCGPACLTMVSKHHGLTHSISKIRQISGTDKMGTNAYGIVKAAETLGFTAKGFQSTREAFLKKMPLPAIAHVLTDEKLVHYVVIYEISEEQVTVGDPAEGIVQYTPEEFFETWTGILILLVPNPEFEKGDKTESLLSHFIRWMKPQKKLLLTAFLFSMLYTILGIVGAFYFKVLIDDILPNEAVEMLIYVSLGFICLHIFRVGLNFFRTHLMIHLSKRLDIELILGYYRHVLKLPMEFFDTRRSGEVLSRLMDAVKVREAISSATLTMMIDVIMVIGAGFILYSVSPYMFWTTAVVIPLYSAIVWAFRKVFTKLNDKQMEQNAILNSFFVESIQGVETIKAYNAEHEVMDESENKFRKMLNTIVKFGSSQNKQESLKGIVQHVGLLIILWVGATQVLQGDMTLGQLITYHALLAYFLDPITNLINLQPMIQTAIVAARRLVAILELDEEKDENEEQKTWVDSLKGPIEIKDVDFRYGTREHVLKKINLTIESGETVAIVGESGSGKTTLTSLLVNFYKPNNGNILINGNNIQDINRESLREKIAYISQNTPFLSGTIKKSLLLGKNDQDINIEKVTQAAKMAEADQFINHLPGKYDTMLEENGANLSGGEKQRLAIARALLKDPNIVIMDEATSNLDASTEKAIYNTMHKYTKNMTTIIVAHRLGTIKQCDKICVMDQGEIIETGTHDELLEKKGKYAELWNNQFRENDPAEYSFS